MSAIDGVAEATGGGVGCPRDLRLVTGLHWPLSNRVRVVRHAEPDRIAMSVS
jgi:hypothetical protein